LLPEALLKLLRPGEAFRGPGSLGTLRAIELEIGEDDGRILAGDVARPHKLALSVVEAALRGHSGRRSA
jgi:hypothetical protein